MRPRSGTRCQSPDNLPTSCTSYSSNPTPTATATFPPATRTPTPTATPFTLHFRADAPSVPLGTCTTLRWDVDGVQSVYLYGNEYGGPPGSGVGGHDTHPACPHLNSVAIAMGRATYTLRATRLDSSIVEETLTILIATPTPGTTPGGP